ncbi:hypothetical protein CSV79_12170 [Sporosarcina sp. P13]|uniref:M20 family metallopeptidase n=1 Tax=Sporosarcina sp. P13 TaxID=2048263 RepID=UPI000C173143|nr:M20 family metallopeptidase [Sporosarcina sp. P13]PIC63386.1 hypothetical protein CSV79_12170 [Sporosarcina sp. P13]
MTSQENTRISEYLAKNEEEALEFLKSIVNTDSFSYDKKGVNNVAAKIMELLESKGISYVIRENEEFGNHIIATIKGPKDGKILLMGHMDTVHPEGTTKERPFTVEGNLLRGPGVSDMKAGLVTMIYAVTALEKFANEDLCDIEILFTPEEEIGSPISRAVIEERAKDALAVFNLEAGRPDGSVVTARKGSAHLKIEIEGKASHSGAFIENGISANDELALKMTKIKELMNNDKGVTVNIGTIKGGVSNNMVSPHAMATVHSGFWKTEDFDELYKGIEKIVNTSYVKGTKSSLSGGVSILPMEYNDGTAQLYKIVQQAAQDMSLPITEQHTKGAADAGFASSMGVPTICAMGPVGGNWHALDEYMELDTFLPRMELLARSILLFSKDIKN